MHIEIDQFGLEISVLVFSSSFFLFFVLNLISKDVFPLLFVSSFCNLIADPIWWDKDLGIVVEMPFHVDSMPFILFTVETNCQINPN